MVSVAQHLHHDYDGVVSAADVIIDLVNTLDVSANDDSIAQVTGLSGRDLRTAVELREHLRSCLLAHHDGVDDPIALSAIEAIVARHPMTLSFVDGAAQLTSARAGIGELVAQMADAIVSLQHDGQWMRVRICPADDCLEAFHDRSRGGTRRWCSMGVCGNRAKVTQYRHRHST